MSTPHKIINPSAAVIVWNYSDRISSLTASDGTTDPNTIDETIVLSTSIISIQTSKSKSQPSGAFEIKLAPTFNWAARITPGSWCSILMSNRNIEVSPDDVGTVSRTSFKMFGRITSVRAVVNVNQSTGARMTYYLASGEDWGAMFNAPLYIDPVARNNDLEKDAFISFSARLGFQQIIKDWIDEKRGALPTAGQWVDAIIQLWGDPLSSLREKLSEISPQLSLSSGVQFLLPEEAVSYMGFSALDGSQSYRVASLIRQIEGILEDLDTYKPIDDARGYPDPNSFFGMNTLWQQVLNNGNSTLNEFIAEVRFDDKPGSTLALYRRIKPFIEGDIPEDLEPVKHLISKFKFVKFHDVPDTEIVSLNAGTNFRDKFNFIEIRPQPLFEMSFFQNPTKRDSQFFDAYAAERDGFKPLFEQVTYMPYESDPANALFEALDWKYILKEWYFNTHNMLNGAATFIGQSDYIAAGDNIRIPVRAFGPSFNLGQGADGGDSYLLANIESVSNSFTVNNNGARSFSTTVQFTRGIIVDSKNNTVNAPDKGALDRFSEALSSEEERNKRALITGSPLNPNGNKVE